jgi:O-antigen ligase
LTFLTLVLTQSRGGALGLAAGLGFWLAWHGPRTRWLLLAASIITLLAVFAVGPEQAATALQGIAGRNLLNDAQARVELWSRALAAIQAFPLTGLGLNGFRQALPVLFPLFIIPPGFDVSHAHNQFLQAALDLGLPGLVALVALFLGAFSLLASARRAVRRADWRLLAEGLAAALAAHLVFGMADAIAFGARVHIFFWGALAYCVCLYRQAQAEQARAEPVRR